QLRQDRRQAISLIDVLIQNKVEFHHTTAKCPNPRLRGAYERDARRKNADTWKNAGLPPLQPIFVALPVHVVPNICAFLFLQHEGRVCHSQGPQYRTQQERLPEDWHGLFSRRVLDAHDAEIAVVAAKFEPELDRGGVGCHCRVATGWKGSTSPLMVISRCAQANKSKHSHA